MARRRKGNAYTFNAESSGQTETGRDAPAMTPELAQVYAKLLTAGCPELTAVQYMAPWLELDLLRPTALAWKTNPDVLQAVNGLNGGAWFDLEPEARMKLAMQKSDAEIAFWLWDASFTDLTAKEELEKLKLARSVVKDLLGMRPDELNPMDAFARWMVDMARENLAKGATKKALPPQFQAQDLLKGPKGPM